MSAINAETINALMNFVKLIGFQNFIILILVIMLIVIAISIKDSISRRFYYNDMKKAKNEEIERLADDNRRYREIYLKNQGLKDKEIRKLMASDIEKKK